jgi:hypothetical protein
VYETFSVDAQDREFVETEATSVVVAVSPSSPTSLQPASSTKRDQVRFIVAGGRRPSSPSPSTADQLQCHPHQGRQNEKRSLLQLHLRRPRAAGSDHGGGERFLDDSSSSAATATTANGRHLLAQPMKCGSCCLQRCHGDDDADNDDDESGDVKVMNALDAELMSGCYDLFGSSE